MNNIEEDDNINHAVYMLGKMTDAINILVTGEGDARSRLRQAIPKLKLITPGMLPKSQDIQKKVSWAFKEMTKFHDPKEYETNKSGLPITEFDSTLRRIKNSTASKIIGELFGAWMDLSAFVDEYYRN